MVCVRPSYKPVAYPVPQYIDYLTATGETTQYEVFFDSALEKRLVKHDHCDLFIPLTIRDNPVHLRAHRESEQCELEIRRILRQNTRQQLETTVMYYTE